VILVVQLGSHASLWGRSSRCRRRLVVGSTV